VSERVWLITGASRGIGAEIAKAVLASGDKLIATARTLSGLEHFEGSENLLSAVLDVGDERQAIKAVEAGERAGQ
jgi:NADP-dependent 3-hydroxy acid dehydrogenase YdfG